MNTDNLALRHRLKTEGVLVTQVVLGGKGQFVDILYTLDILGFDTHLIHLPAVEGHIFITSFYCCYESLRL